MLKKNVPIIHMLVFFAVILMIPCTLYLHYSSIEGRYIGVVVQRLDGSDRYIELRGGEIHVYAVHPHDHTSAPVYEGVVGHYTKLENGLYELAYIDFDKNPIFEAPRVQVYPSLWRLEMDPLDAARLEVHLEGAYKRLYFWSLWW